MKKKKTKINRAKRRFLHAVWPKLVLNQLALLNSELGYMIRTERAGLTRGEQKYIEERMTTIAQLSNDMHMIYQRLKR